MIAGLTGGIGSGKSVVAKLFELLGWPVFNSDTVAKDLYFDGLLQSQIISLLGEEAYLNASQINKPYISAKIFNDSDLLIKLNALIHPAVINRFKAFAEEHKGKIIVKETALLFETQQEAQMDKVITVVSKDELRIQRIINRDGISAEEIAKKINSQMPQEEKIKHSDFVIYNNEDEFLIPQVLAIFKELNDSIL